VGILAGGHTAGVAQPQVFAALISQLAEEVA
jgi:hypothetical protein